MTLGRWVGLILTAALAGGCNSGERQKAPEPAPAPTNSQEVGNTKVLVEGITGKTAVDAGARAREAIKKVNAARQDNLKAIDEE